MNILVEQEIALHQHKIRQNESEIARLIHPDFRETGVSGTSYDYAAIVKMLGAEQAWGGYLHSQDFECIPLEPSIQLLLYKSALVSESGEVSNYAKRSSIWVFTGQHWQMKYHQGTACNAFKVIP